MRSRLSKECLELDCEAAVADITAALREFVFVETRRKGVVLGISGGIDSSVCAALSVARAVMV